MSVQALGLSLLVTLASDPSGNQNPRCPNTCSSHGAPRGLLVHACAGPRADTCTELHRARPAEKAKHELGC